ncbi:hypothetical protein V8C35DRAFT_290240 [Trichoderma chlorosporum]
MGRSTLSSVYPTVLVYALLRLTTSLCRGMALPSGFPSSTSHLMMPRGQITRGRTEGCMPNYRPVTARVLINDSRRRQVPWLYRLARLEIIEHYIADIESCWKAAWEL